ncbi:MAG: hypothetical protein ACTSQO_08060 [Candidatus Helarchaeota archaeon]
MIVHKKLYSILCYIEITLGILLIISTIIEIFFLKVLYDYNLVENIYVIFLGIGGFATLFGGLFSLGILPIASCTPSFICMLLLLNNEDFWAVFRPDILVFLILSLIIGVLLIIFYQEFIPEKRNELKDLLLKELDGIKNKQIEKLNMIGIETLNELIEEKENLKEIAKLTNIDRKILKRWIDKAEAYEKEYQDYQKEKLKKSYWKSRKNKR